MAEIVDLTVTRGDSEVFNVTFKDAAGAACDITGWTVTFTIKREKSDPDSAAVAQKVVTEHTEPESGTAVITLLPADTTNLEPRGYWYDIQAKTDAGDVYTVLKGKLTLEYDVTRTA